MYILRLEDLKRVKTKSVWILPSVLYKQSILSGAVVLLLKDVKQDIIHGCVFKNNQKIKYNNQVKTGDIMKNKITLILLSVIILFSVTACGNSSASDNSSSAVETTTEETTEESTTVKPTVKETSKPESKAESKTESQTEAVKEETTAVHTNEYLLPYSDTRKLTKSDLAPLSKKQLELARNEIYARHGRKFKTEYIQEYFNMTHWYKGTVEPENFSESVLNDIEKYNINFISNYEDNYTENSSGSSKTQSRSNVTSSSANNGAYNNIPQLCGVCGGGGGCMKCYGTGDCSYCYGKGRSLCNYCSGGKCYSCGGTGYVYKYVGILHGKYPCTMCNGSGNCNVCGGSRYTNCIICGGSGNCGNCYGNGSCQSCHGTGFQY